MTTNLAASLYLISGVLFILALRGLSSPDTSRQGNFFGVLVFGKVFVGKFSNTSKIKFLSSVLFSFQLKLNLAKICVFIFLLIFYLNKLCLQ